MAQPPPSTTTTDLDLQITPLTLSDTSRLPALFATAASAFGAQINDLIWTSFSPSWSTPAGITASVDRYAARLRNTTYTSTGDPCDVFLEASVADPTTSGGRLTVGVAIWVQLSAAAGWGTAPRPEDMSLEARIEALGLRDLYPGDERRQRWLAAVDAGLHGPREAVVRAKRDDKVPAVLVLDLCAVRPEWQGRGVARGLVEWGIREAERRGGLECLTEASVMGRRQYEKLGFREMGQIEYGVPEELRDVPGRELPDNVFMRTAPP